MRLSSEGIAITGSTSQQIPGAFLVAFASLTIHYCGSSLVLIKTQTKGIIHALKKYCPLLSGRRPLCRYPSGRLRRRREWRGGRNPDFGPNSNANANSNSGAGQRGPMDLGRRQ
jgi:hypothetical protein